MICGSKCLCVANVCLCSGKSVLNQKSELTKAMEKRLDKKKQKEAEKMCVDRRNSFERKLAEQANKLSVSEQETAKKNSANSTRCDHNQSQSPTPAAAEQEIPEFLRIHAKLHAAHADNKNANMLDNAQRT